YRLYALSNIGSLLALISFPFFFEPNFARKTVATMWGWGLLVYGVCAAWSVSGIWQLSLASPNKQPSPQSPPRSQQALWILLPGCASVLLLATTNKLCQDVAVIPFLWVLPLLLYLLTFIISFDNSRWYARGPFALALALALGGICWCLRN